MIKHEPRTIDTLRATREASRSAHRWRDGAAGQYRSVNYPFASHAKERKEYMYQMKHAGIMSLHRSGLLPYIGALLQGMAVTSTGTAACAASTPPSSRMGMRGRQ